ncbi:hypothetical protein Pint_26379 [Pistacia integerrima]|uniref:Uncharacterized protein n=1 Tax=Pistacia integerrima TaxID=434235 RepID=A0ACC0YB41_9ROSI|nr:hypothetical protein Pint_26379 [Pistacia integerrima]
MAQEDSQVETLDSTSAGDQSQPSSSDLSRSASFSKLNARAPEFVPARSPTTSSTTSSTASQSQVQLQVPSPPRVMMPSPAAFHNHHPPHVYSPHQGTAFHVPMQNHVIPVHHHPHHHQIQHHVQVQNYHNHHPHHHRNHNQKHKQKHNHFHHYDEENQEVEVTVEDQKDQKDQHHGGLSDESTQKILNQVEYYFSDLNLATTDHLMRFIHKDPEGYVPISVVASFKKIKALINSNSQLANVLRNSSKLVVSEDGRKVKRQNPLTESDVEELQSRIVVAENLPEDHCHQNLMKIFSAVGSVNTIRTCLPQTSGGGAPSASRLTKADGMLFSNKLHAFVEYESVELAEKAIADLNNEGNWRSGLRVRLMHRRASKNAQARGRKGHEGEWHYEEEDTSTSEHHSNEKQLEDHPQQQNDHHSHEYMGEEHVNDKEGGHRKGRNKSRGKGRGRGDRGQYHHNNHNRGHHVGTPPSNNMNNSEQSTIGKQPPGPRMPDGTRGFAMGRGKPVAVSTS